MSDLHGKVALVTGGTSGIGKAAARALAGAGARVVLAARDAARGRSTAEEIEEQGGSVLFVPTDVSRSEDVARVIEAATTRFGRLDCAINNAASRHGFLVPFTDLT